MLNHALATQSSTCALQVIARLLVHAFTHQETLYNRGSFDQLSFLPALMQLHALIRAGGCSATRCLEDREMPALAPLLAKLPPDMAAELEAAIAAERAGHHSHAHAHLQTRAEFSLPTALPQVESLGQPPVATPTVAFLA